MNVSNLIGCSPVQLISVAALPAGVTLQANDGEAMTSLTTMSNTYYARNGYAVPASTGYTGKSWDDPSFFPLACFFGLYADASSDLTTYADLGFNLSTCVTASSNFGLLSGAHVWDIDGNGGGDITGPSNVYVAGVHIDEPTLPSGIQSAISAVSNANQAGRLWDLVGTWNQIAGGGEIGGTPLSTLLALNHWTLPGGGNTSIGFYYVDIYWFASSPSANGQSTWGKSILKNGATNATAAEMARGCHYGNMVDFNRAMGNGSNDPTVSNAASRIPMAAVVEWSDGLLTDPGVRGALANEIPWAMWSMIIHGARRVEVFVGPARNIDTSIQSGQSISRYNAIKNANAAITSLASVINSPSAVGFASVSPAGYAFPVYQSNWLNGGVEFICKWFGGNFYIFAATREPQSTTNLSATFTVARGTLATVLNESRTIGISGGTFTDTFANAWTVHIYKIT